MKKITYILASMLILSLPLSAQGEVDALRFSREDLYGTARSMAMGGAFGALGGDLTGVNINPAGIAVYRSSEVVGTVNLSIEGSSVGNYDAKKSNFNMDNLGFVGYFPLRNDIMPHINFGFSYNKLKSFNKNVDAVGVPGNSMLDYIADRSTGINPTNLYMGDDLPDPFESQPWLTVLGYNSWLIDDHQDAQGYYYTPLNTPGAIGNEIKTRESGYIDNYDFTVGTTINNVLNLGLSLSIKDITYRLTSDFWEDYTDGSYRLTNWLTTDGAGVSAKIGAIYRPVNQLRFGISYHTPTYYAMTETYEAELEDNMGAYVSDPNYEKGTTNSRRFSNDYDLRTPGKIVASAAAVLGNRFILSVDYEMVDYSKMKLMIPSNSMDDEDWYEVDNGYISTDFKNASTVKVGTEYRFTPKFYGRLGYAWIQNPYETEFKESGDAFIPNSNTVYRMEGDAKYFTGGIGYRFNQSFFLDFALVYKTQTDDLYPFPNLYTDNRTELVIDANPFELKNNSFRGLITLGYKF
ncbi:OmpP1/FadL family transporter [Lascolabacillus massiliensis]|uniref:OmpP1/FadL family transporter n=1 Tax=Lascolabacillus massiliensis TaxID=1627894 RepID=UPI0006B39B61|nr:outer membrane protein transport protein [Lascolabacillus massiliensis]